ncbi:CYFA0S17e00474g1_1 [Cyberlindnera fabianii]|nr:CYFA0S17e00474g1_1 [Cyberlindnera fabianii]
MAQPKGVITTPQILTLRDGSKGTLIPFYKRHLEDTAYLPPTLVDFLYGEFSREVDKGDTYPHLHPLSKEEFVDYWFGAFCAVLLRGENTIAVEGMKWEEEVLGTYYIKPNYIGRCSHNCNGGFLVNHRMRGNSVGKALGRSYLKWAPILGYTYSVFNLVFETNPASIKIWDDLGFDRIGRIPNVGDLKGKGKVSAIMFGKELV